MGLQILNSTAHISGLQSFPNEEQAGDHAPNTTTVGCKNYSGMVWMDPGQLQKIRVLRDYHSLLGLRPLEMLRVRHPLLTQLLDGDQVDSTSTQAYCDVAGNILIKEIPNAFRHAGTSGEDGASCLLQPAARLRAILREFRRGGQSSRSRRRELQQG